MAQYPTMREYRQHRVHDFGAILPVLSVLGYWAIILDFGGPGSGLSFRATWLSRQASAFFWSLP